MKYTQATKEQLAQIVLYENCSADEKTAAGAELMRRRGKS